MTHAPGSVPSRTESVQNAMPRRLSTRLVWITMSAILLAQVLILLPSITTFRHDWLAAKIEAVALASFASGQGNGIDGPMLSPEREAELLRTLDAELIAVEQAGISRLIARMPEVSTVEREFEIETESFLTCLGRSLRTMVDDGSDLIRVSGPIGDGSMRAEVVMFESALRVALWEHARKFLLVGLMIALFAGLLLSIAIDRLLVGPIRQMTLSMICFGQQPEDPSRIIAPSARDDELGLASRELARMQGTLARTLRERRHLADLGLAVSKINHDLRNTLASAQLVSDRLSDIADPEVQRFAPTLIRSLDRALAYTRSVLAYGRAAEAVPVKRKLRLFILVEEIMDASRARHDSGIELVNDVPTAMEIEVDPEQFHRALGNLVRNALDALEADEGGALVRQIRVSARTSETGVLIAVEDTGPGLSEQAKKGLFQAFRGSTRLGGTGLGLAIASEIVEAHGGRIRHCDRPPPGARFEIELPGAAGDASSRDATTSLRSALRAIRANDMPPPQRLDKSAG